MGHSNIWIHWRWRAIKYTYRRLRRNRWPWWGQQPRHENLHTSRPSELLLPLQLYGLNRRKRSLKPEFRVQHFKTYKNQNWTKWGLGRAHAYWTIGWQWSGSIYAQVHVDGQRFHSPACWWRKQWDHTEAISWARPCRLPWNPRCWKWPKRSEEKS